MTPNQKRQIRWFILVIAVAAAVSIMMTSCGTESTSINQPRKHTKAPSETPNVSFWNTPQNWTLLQDATTDGNVTSFMYEGKGTTESAVADFTAELEKAGWKHGKDNITKAAGIAGFEKDNYDAVVSAVENPPDSIIVSVTVTRIK